MAELKQLSDDVYEQIKDFDYWELTEEQNSLVDKLILDEELKKNYKRYGLCKTCKQPKQNTSSWCQCYAKIFQQNFKNWTSGNSDVDKFIQRVQLKARNKFELVEWIEYGSFENIAYLSKGGSGTTFKAVWKDGPIEERDSQNNQWKRERKYDFGLPVVLKCLHNSQNITAILKEIELHIILVNSEGCIVRCYGITKDPETNNFIMVMEYAQNGNLRQHLNNNFNLLNWHEKVYNLYTIALGLNTIHEKGLMHRDFHCGNILINTSDSGERYSLIAGLGLCEPANVEHGDKKIYGVLPYVAPEVLKGKEYTQASDIYGFGIIAHELCTGLPPYNDITHDESLAIKICQGIRPKSDYTTPQLILDIIQQCWDSEPLKRPSAHKLYDLFLDLWRQTDKSRTDYEENAIINKQIREAEEINKQLPVDSVDS